MRPSSSGPLNLLRRLPRAIAGSVAALAELSPLRAVMALVIALGFGASAAVAVTSVGGSSMQAVEPAVLSQRPAPTTSRDSVRPEVPGSGGFTTESSPSRPGPTAKPSPSDKAGARKTSPPSRTVGPPAGPGQRSGRSPNAESSNAATPSGPSGGTSDGAQADGSAPETVMAEWYPDSDDAVFSFRADEPASYQCSLDAAPYTPCDSPVSLSDMHPGWHTFAVRGVDADGNADPSAAFVRWHVNASSASDGAGH